MSVIVGGARTGIGRLLGSLKDVSAVELGATAIRGLWKNQAYPHQMLIT